MPTDLAIVQVGDTYLLAFASAVDNVGRGPLLIEGARPSRREEAMAVRQLVRRADGSAEARPVPLELRYAREESHEHWHLLDFMRYELAAADSGELVQPAEKTGFCLGDRYDTDRARRGEYEPERAVWTEECGPGQPGLLELREGISPGFGDDYEPQLEGQYVDVTSVPAGRYVLVHRVNPEGALAEASLANNAASVLVQLRRTTGVIPSVRVLARCPDAVRCEAGAPGD